MFFQGRSVKISHFKRSYFKCLVFSYFYYVTLHWRWDDDVIISKEKLFFHLSLFSGLFHRCQEFHFLDLEKRKSEVSARCHRYSTHLSRSSMKAKLAITDKLQTNRMAVGEIWRIIVVR